MMYLFQHEDFSDLINQTSQEIKMPFSFVEKDYWVTYVLYRLKEEDITDFIFKGGTSLTKAWGLLDRFSEDIDLLFIPHTQITKLKSIFDITTIFSSYFN